MPITFFFEGLPGDRHEGAEAEAAIEGWMNDLRFFIELRPNQPKFIDAASSPRDELDSLPDFLREKVQANTENGNRLLGAEFDCLGVPF